MSIKQIFIYNILTRFSVEVWVAPWHYLWNPGFPFTTSIECSWRRIAFILHDATVKDILFVFCLNYGYDLITFFICDANIFTVGKSLCFSSAPVACNERISEVLIHSVNILVRGSVTKGFLPFTHAATTLACCRIHNPLTSGALLAMGTFCFKLVVILRQRIIRSLEVGFIFRQRIFRSLEVDIFLLYRFVISGEVSLFSRQRINISIKRISFFL